MPAIHRALMRLVDAANAENVQSADVFRFASIPKQSHRLVSAAGAIARPYACPSSPRRLRSVKRPSRRGTTHGA